MWLCLYSFHLRGIAMRGILCAILFLIINVTLGAADYYKVLGVTKKASNAELKKVCV